MTDAWQFISMVPADDPVRDQEPRHPTISPMPIAFDVGPLKAAPAGVGIYVRSLAQGLHEIGRSDVAFIGRRPDAAGLPEGVPALDRSARLPYPLLVAVAGDRDAGRTNARLAHFTDGLVTLVRRRPTVVTVLDLSLVRHWRAHRLFRYPRIPFVLAAPRLADRVIAISRATADEVRALAGVPARKIDVIPLAARPVARPRAHDEVADAITRHGLGFGPYLLVPGTIEPRKNLPRVVQAFERLVSRPGRAADLRLVLAGQVGWGSGPTLRAIDESGAHARISRLGYVSDDDLAALMTGASAVVYVSTYEGFGLPVIEAMACGAVVVTSNVSSMPEVAGDAGILVDPGSVASIADGMEEALRADASARDQSLRRAAELSWAATARATAEVYDAVAPP